MKINFLKIGFFAILFSMALFATSCGGEHSHEEGDDTHEHHDHDGAHEHDHEHDGGLDEEMEIDSTGKEFTSAFVCPMHCSESGSETAGKCPTCGMDYVENTVE